MNTADFLEYEISKAAIESDADLDTAIKSLDRMESRAALTPDAISAAVSHAQLILKSAQRRMQSSAWGLERRQAITLHPIRPEQAH